MSGLRLEELTALIGTAIRFLFLLLFCAVSAYQAKRRGYSFFVWLIAGALTSNPIFLLVFLGSCPHRARQKLREQFRQELDAKLATAGVPAVLRVAHPAAERSLGDLPTQLPAASASTDGPPAREQSLGDVPTVLPEARSLGDEPTRL